MIDVISEAVERYAPSHGFALFSGGHDSLCLTHVAMQHPAVQAVVHVNTGIGIEQTREFVRETCKAQAWPLLELHPPALSYDEMVLKYGFPGPGGHRYPFVWLKERALRKLIREHREGRRPIMLVTGVRSEESTRRMGHVEPIKKEKGSRIVWVSPLHDWSSYDVTRYIAEHALQRNAVTDRLHMSGECLCGAFAKPGELEQIGMWYPDIVQRIRDLEQRAERAGVHCRWGTRPPKFYAEKRAGQIDMFEDILCRSCSKRMEDAA